MKNENEIKNEIKMVVTIKIVVMAFDTYSSVGIVWRNPLYGDIRLSKKRVLLVYVQQYLNSPQKLTLKTTEDNSAISDDKALVVFGIGLGLHLFELIRSTEVKHVVIYEPNVDFLVCSLYAGVWPKIFDLAQKKKVSLYFQVPNKL